jgi:acyl-CoA thioester hydrolase
MVSAMDLRFRRPARIDDHLQVRTVFETIRGARLIARQAVTRGPEIIVEASCENVCVDFQGRPRRPPALLMAKIRNYLATSTDAPDAPANDREAASVMVAAE